MKLKKYLLFVCLFSIQSFPLFAKDFAKKDYVKQVISGRIEEARKTGILDLSKLRLKKLNALNELLGRNDKKIKEIRLDFNEIKTIKRDDLNKFRNLQNLDLSNNEIEKIDKGSFFSLKKLKALDLSHNKIKNMPSNIFVKQSRLVNLDLSDNLIKTLNKQWFRNLKDLEKVNLADNKITHIPATLFKRNKKLKEIYLKGNKVERFKAGFEGKDFRFMITDLKDDSSPLNLWG